jgi:cysteinylglycine-S-conjugate dipeptidase
VSPHAEMLLLGVEEPGCRIHAPDESVHPEELRRTALAQALFLVGFS